nr:MAG TPA: nucelotide kinase [Bacteriophage sp.]
MERSEAKLNQAVRITNGDYQGKIATIYSRHADFCCLDLKTFDKTEMITCHYEDLEPYDAADVPIVESNSNPKEIQSLPDIVVCKPDDDGKYHDAHYANMAGLEPIEVMQLVMSREEFIGFLKGNIIKYTMRAGHKQGEAAEKDIAKAKRYKQWLMEMLYIEKIIDPKKED